VGFGPIRKDFSEILKVDDPNLFVTYEAIKQHDPVTAVDQIAYTFTCGWKSSSRTNKDHSETVYRFGKTEGS